MVINFIGVIRIVRVIVVIILEGQFEMLVLLILVMESGVAVSQVCGLSLSKRTYIIDQ